MFELFKLWIGHESCPCNCIICSFDYCRPWTILFIKNFSMEQCVVLHNIPKVILKNELIDAIFGFTPGLACMNILITEVLFLIISYLGSL